MRLNSTTVVRMLRGAALWGIWQAATIVHANPIMGTIVGVFSNPVLAGYDLNNPTIGSVKFEDNTGTAVVGIATPGGTSCAPANVLCWGGYTPPPAIPTNQQYSALTFTGKAGYTGTGEIGTITFLNGSSDINSVIFGATLSFYLNSVSSGNFLGSDNVIITSAANQYSGIGLTQAQLQTDADYINICGNNSNICASSIEAYESSEGGTSLIVDLNAIIIGDPTLLITGATVDPQTNSTSGGVIGTEDPAPQVPEPSTWSLISIGLIGFVWHSASLKERGRQFGARQSRPINGAR